MINFLISTAHAYTFFDLSDFASTTLPWLAGLINDLKPIWYLVVILLVGAAIISLIIRSLHR